MMAKEQPFSLLHLPIEVRLMIYEYAIGGNHFQLAYITQHVILEKRFYLETVPTCSGVESRLRVDWRKQYLLLSLPLPCRQVYHEVIDLLYRCNTFVAQGPRVLFNFAIFSLQLQRLHSNRHLDIMWNVDTD